LNRVGTLNKLNRTFAVLEQQFQRDPSAEELADVLELAPEEVRETAQMGTRQVSINAPFMQGEENGLLDVLEDESEETPDSTLISHSLCQDVQRSLATLTERESDVISLYFGLNGQPAMTLEEIGLKFKLTRERVRQVKEKGIRRLRSTSRSSVLKHYLG
jgi:RNA polymerase primary sigma factor